MPTCEAHGTQVTGWLAGFTERRSGVVVWAAAIPLIAAEAVSGPDVNTGGWERLAHLFPFLHGFLIAPNTPVRGGAAALPLAALAVACAAGGALRAWAGALNGSGAGLGAGVPPEWSALPGLTGWAWLEAILGFAGSIAAPRRDPPGKTLTRPAAVGPEPRCQRAARYGNQAILPSYLLHEPVIVAAA